MIFDTSSLRCDLVADQDVRPQQSTSNQRGDKSLRKGLHEELLWVRSIAFPVLNKEQIAQSANCATISPKRYRDGETLVAVGDRSFKFFIVKSGEIDIVDCSGEAPKTMAVHGKGEFTGDISHLTGTPAIFTAIARGDCEVFEVSGEALRQVLNQCPGLSDIILQAFIERQQLLRESPNFIGLRVIGSRYSPDTFRVRDFLIAFYDLRFSIGYSAQEKQDLLNFLSVL